MNDVLARSLLAALLIGLGIGVYWAWNRLQLRRLNQARGTVLAGLQNTRPGVAAVLYFTTPDCLVCKTAQKPALQRLETELRGAVQIVEIDATVDTEVADYWGVLSVPTTFVIDAHGQPRSINHGLTSKEKLQRQIEATFVSPAANANAAFELDSGPTLVEPTKRPAPTAEKLESKP